MYQQILLYIHRYTVVQNYMTYWVKQVSDVIRYQAGPTNPPTQPPATTQPRTTTQSPTTTQSTVQGVRCNSCQFLNFTCSPAFRNLKVQLSEVLNLPLYLVILKLPVLKLDLCWYLKKCMAVRGQGQGQFTCNGKISR